MLTNRTFSNIFGSDVERFPANRAHKSEWFDYKNQAWVGTDGLYIICGHTGPCSCYGKKHFGEKAPEENRRSA